MFDIPTLGPEMIFSKQFISDKYKHPFDMAANNLFNFKSGENYQQYISV